jgi:aspartate kinase
MGRVVLKYGGSSVATIEKMQLLAPKILQRASLGEQIVIVVSAMGNSTNHLLDLAKKASSHPPKREIDLLISTGEQVSISLFTMVLKEIGGDAIALTGFQAGIHTIGLHTKNKIKEIDTRVIEKHLDAGKIVVVAGFQGLNDEGDITTLGRGGSDTTAVAIAAKLHTHAEIYTDVDGIYGVDPRLFPQAKKINTITYEEMKEMAFLGAKVMEPRSIEIGHRFGVKIYVASAHGDVAGTWIMEESPVEEKQITGLSISQKLVMVTLRNVPNKPRVIADLFAALAQNEVNVDIISKTTSIQDLINVAFTASSDDYEAIETVVQSIQKNIPSIEPYYESNIVKVSVVGTGMRTQSGVAAKLFTLLADHDIEFKLVTTSEISISYTMDKSYQEIAVQVIASAFGL